MKNSDGVIQINNGRIVSYDENDEELWSFDLDAQSPMMKYSIWHHYTQSDYRVKNPFYVVAWEILNSYHPTVGTGWWGHCNGWSAATIFVKDPATLTDGKTEVELVDGQMISFDVGDLKGLLTESKQKLQEIQPLTIGQASRVSGVTPADISILIGYIDRN